MLKTVFLSILTLTLVSVTSVFAAQPVRIGVSLGMSSDSDSEDVRATLDAGAAGFILKPYVLADLGRAICETLRE